MFCEALAQPGEAERFQPAGEAPLSVLVKLLIG